MTKQHDEAPPLTRWDEYSAELNLPPVLQHALDSFVRIGYHGTTVRDLAKRLGQTVPAIYYHFENKQALLFTLLTRSIDDLLERCMLAARNLSNRMRQVRRPVLCRPSPSEAG